MTDEIIDNQLTSNVPHAALRSLDVLVGTWQIFGPTHSGTVTYEWMPGGHFLVQHVNLIQDDHCTTGVEYIGYDADTDTLKSHFFGSTGDILEYVYELADRNLTIWFGQPGSPAKYTGTFDAQATSATGAWTWPGGGYTSIMTRVRP
ncbi:DUF1579 domain-containing protein [Micromonospora deserti]|uniref:DUF1579 domain-containing protein n=1 Tax=Micromonospora deserti TaxID=2070366 RepID=A0A2W2CEP1_9ACTN|nr:DUF1579 domain-containing protein [Micromonospora deserti]PZF96250.1 hypothetical protein C1I99_17355 [Micromonospora deserti]